MIKNNIYNITIFELDDIRKNAKINNDHLVEIQGKEIQSWDEYLDVIEIVYKFPTGWRVNIHGYIDWMLDLDWLGKNSYILIIHDYSDFLKQNMETKKMVMEIFEEEILPWWQSDVEKYCAGGKAKPFNVYLVN